MKLLNSLKRARAQKHALRRARQLRECIRREAAIGGQLFGEIPSQVRREFVCVNKHTWLWHEEWIDQQNTWHMATTRYDVRPDGIYKMQEGQAYQPVSAQEARHLLSAAKLYHQEAQRILYSK